MKRKVVSVLLCAAMVMSMAGCGNGTQEETAGNTSEATETVDESAENTSEGSVSAVPPQFAAKLLIRLWWKKLGLLMRCGKISGPFRLGKVNLN